MARPQQPYDDEQYAHGQSDQYYQDDYPQGQHPPGQGQYEQGYGQPNQQGDAYYDERLVESL